MLSERAGIYFWEFDLLKNCPKVIHGSCQRHGGFSEGPFGSLNTSFKIGDREEHVQQNLDKIQKTFSLEKLSYCTQVHGLEVLEAEKGGVEGIGDALVTSRLNVGIVARHADCQAGLFYDPQNHVAAFAHAGWRGSVQNIYAHLINYLRNRFTTKPENLLVCLSPSLGPEAAEFINYRTELPETFWDFQVKPNYFDFWAISEWQLTQAGVKKEHIEIAKICTYSNPKDYFSYRHEKGSGRLATFIALL